MIEDMPSQEEQDIAEKYCCERVLIRPDTDVRKAVKCTAVFTSIVATVSLCSYFLISWLGKSDSLPFNTNDFVLQKPFITCVIVTCAVLFIALILIRKMIIIGCVKLYQNYSDAINLLGRVADNPGAGGVASMGAGMGMGLGAGSAFAGIAQEAFVPAQQPFQQQSHPVAQQPSGRFTQKQAMDKCPSCNAENAQGAKFCNSCGGKMVAKKAFCSGCGAEMPGTAKFCSECGSKRE